MIWVRRAAIISLFVLFVFGFGYVEALYSIIVPLRPAIVERTALYVLVWQHLVIALVPTLAALAISAASGCLLHVYGNEELKSLAISLGSIGETFPSVAIIALSVPVLGYGNLPCMLALFIYAVLPILRNTVTGLSEVPRGITEAARGMGMDKFQMLFKVELPLAWPVMAAGLRIALIINISAATLGATVGAGGLGIPIVAGIRTYDILMVIKGTMPVLLMALFADSMFAGRSEKRA
ncbi:MAG TPA: ABC transporter permease [Bacillota bacterium]|nr:ABC transporter permease [Bacillota bacterium]HOH10003.1 ABC transporter permease [Bacillota bacterium]HOS50398.1 ABC transporter permease [Bacillota bacterium]HOY88849.1 ABC transporter permease [Bacillota bacterium]HPI01257.1 ABC transporter permease [Bacillota bacterium]